MKKNALLLFAFLILGSLAAQDILLWRKGSPAPPILVYADAPEPVRQAAEALSQWLERATGETWHITDATSVPANALAIRLGDAARAGLPSAPEPSALPHDGYWIRQGADGVRIAGRDYAGGDLSMETHPLRSHEAWNGELRLCAFGDMGTWNGVHQFLESLGFRWFMPGEEGTEVPSLEEIALSPREGTKAPAFEYRYAWLADFKFYPQDALWYRRIGYGAPAPVNIGHAFGIMLKYADSHPEYFALIDGKRDTSNLSVLSGGNLCLSQPKAVEIWIEEMRAFFQKNPQLTIFPICPNDCMTRICECPECQAQVSPQLGEKGLFSNYVWGFAAKVAKAAKTEFPDKKVGCFAYSNYQEVPDCLTEIPDNLAVMICYQRQNERTPGGKAQIRNAIESWSRLVDAIYLWTYPHLNYWKPWRHYPRFYPHLLAGDIRANHALGNVKGEFVESESFDASEGAQRGWKYDFHYPWLNHLTAYLIAKLLWEPECDLDALLDDYYLRFYGPAGDPMKEFWTRVEKLTMERPFQHPFDVYTPADAKSLVALLQRAVGLVPEGSVYRARLEGVLSEFLLGAEALLKIPESAELPVPRIPAVPTGQKDGLFPGIPAHEMTQSDGSPAPQRSLVQIAAAPEGLLLHFYCQEDPARGVHAQERPRDDGSLWKDDSIEVLLCPPDGQNGLHFILGARNSRYDARWGDPRDRAEDRSWNPDYAFSSQLESGFWTATLCLPWEMLGAQDASGLDMKGNFFRNRTEEGKSQLIGLFPTQTNQYRVPAAFAKLLVE